MKLTVAIPVRWSDERTDILERVAYPNLDGSVPPQVRFLVVDDGSPADPARQLHETCVRLGFDYLHLDTGHLPFSIGRARNAAAQHGTSPYLMFQDADLMPYPGFYADVLRECAVSGLDASADNFLMIGVIYLTRRATEQFLATEPALRRQTFIHRLLVDDKTAIEKFSTGTSVTVWRRDYFLASGGNDAEFNGWGYEDLEYATRAIRRRKLFPLPSEFALDYRNFQSVVEYKGWKSVYRLFGDLTFQKGIVMFHAWHPVEQDSRYMAARAKNRKLFEAKMAAFRDKGIEPDPLPMASAGRSLVMRENPWVMNRWATPFLGELVHIEEAFLPPENFLRFLTESGFSRVIFHNPYANDAVRALYQQVRDAGFPYMVIERGALPGSVFFDPNGFNADSDSYHERHWNHALTHEERAATREYITTSIINEASLEEQPERIGPIALRRKLKIGRGKRVLVAFLQRPSDTVIRHFCGPIGSYDNFIRLLARLPYTLPSDWVLVVKQHPLESAASGVLGACDGDKANTTDLLDMCDAMITINSGVGVQGLMFGKPVLHCGDAFYGWPGVACQVVNEEQVNTSLRSFTPDAEKVERFLSYLVNRFYSFARFTTRKVAWEDGNFMTATTAIDYYVLRVPGHAEMRREIRDKVEVHGTSILFDRYRKADGNINTGLIAAPARVTSKPGAKWGSHTVEAGSATTSGQPDLTTPAHPPLQVRSARAGSLRRKLKKLTKNPVMFFRDSTIGLFRMVGNRMIRD
ncbi:hypothetical protein AWV79_09345 [Cupriavidus sp. UYMMa02A]|nr:hypothetical protein AWV79_09345 [Cupriavidus sp. UYMMa02A]